jgi:class 3 adenylate cyclase
VPGSAPSGVVTFLFTDIEGSTLAWDRDGAAMAMALRRHDEVLQSAIVARGGHVFSTAGDGCAAAFSRAEDAAMAAVEAQRLLGAEPWPESAPVKVRMGLHTGRAIERDGDYFGPVVIRAARLMALVGGGRIVCSKVTAELVGALLPEDVVLTPVGTVRLRGLSAPEQASVLMGAGLDESGAALRSEVPFGRRLPRTGSALIGRAGELDTIASLVERERLVTLIGFGGVGKTRLAVAVAARASERFTDGVAWVDLASVADEADVVRVVADVLEVAGAETSTDLADRIVAALAGRRVLVVLDNCEHVRRRVASIVEQLVVGTDHIAVLATSRESLRVDGERAVRVDPLATDSRDAAAVELLIELMGSTVNELTDNDVEALVRLAPGHPVPDPQDVARVVVAVDEAPMVVEHGPMEQLDR